MTVTLKESEADAFELGILVASSMINLAALLNSKCSSYPSEEGLADQVEFAVKGAKLLTEELMDNIEVLDE